MLRVPEGWPAKRPQVRIGTHLRTKYRLGSWSPQRAWRTTRSRIVHFPLLLHEVPPVSQALHGRDSFMECQAARGFIKGVLPIVASTSSSARGHVVVPITTPQWHSTESSRVK